jgi:hypothetical protein
MDDRVPSPITRLGPPRDRPFDAAHFDRIEAARGTAPRERRRRPASPRPRPARRAEAADDPAEPPAVGTRIDVRA